MGKRHPSAMISRAALCGEYEAVYRYVLTLCQDETEAQDLTQETFLKALRAANRFDGDSSLYTWLCAIAKNLWRNQCKKQAREQPLACVPDTQPSTDPPLEQQAAEKDASLRIHRALHALQEPYKEVFSLRVFGQLSFAEIADLFCKTESWARVTYYRARKRLNEAIRKEGYDV